MEKKRLLSLDVLRGATVCLMILVNNGAGKHIYATLQHSKWNGMTPCDLVFPFFLFIMGISTYLSLEKTNFTWSRQVAFKIVKRTVLLFFIGLFINWFDMAISGNALDFSHLRIWAVMQRIAICYFAVSIFALCCNHRHTIPAIVILLAAYSLLLIWGNGYAYDSQQNILAQIDIRLFGIEHLYHNSPVDPEGTGSSLSAIAHTLIGFYCGKRMSDAKSTEEKVLRFLITGCFLVIIGYIVSFGLPLNKRIWSPSYVCMTCGLAAVTQGLLMYCIDIKGIKTTRLTFFLVFGTNPLFLYVASELIAILFGYWEIKDKIYNLLSSLTPDPYLASLEYAALFMMMHAAIGYPLWKKKIYIKL